MSDIVSYGVTINRLLQSDMIDIHRIVICCKYMGVYDMCLCDYQNNRTTVTVAGMVKE